MRGRRQRFRQRHARAGGRSHRRGGPSRPHPLPGPHPSGRGPPPPHPPAGGWRPARAASPIHVLFSPFTNGFADLRPRTTVSTLAGTGANSSLDGPVSLATFWGPFGTAVDAGGTVYVADYTNNKLRKISAGNVSTLAG